MLEPTKAPVTQKIEPTIEPTIAPSVEETVVETPGATPVPTNEPTHEVNISIRRIAICICECQSSRLTLSSLFSSFIAYTRGKYFNTANRDMYL
jgi:hypothetical protein